MKINIENYTKEQILEGFVNICKNGTSKDCMIYVNEAKRKGISYEELCEYKRKGE